MGGGAMEPLEEQEKWVIVLEIGGRVDERTADAMSRAFHECLEAWRAEHGITCRVVYNVRGRAQA